MKEKDAKINIFKIPELEQNINSNANQIGDLAGNGLTETDLATAIKNDRSQLLENVQQITKNENAIKTGDFTDYFDTQYKGAEIYFPYTVATYGTYQSIIDALVADNCNSVSINPKLNMANQTANTLTRMAPDADITGAIAYAKSKGLKVMLKCHYSGGVSGQYQVNPSDSRAWIQSWSDNVMYYVNLVASNLDLVCLINEAVYVTDSDADLWQLLHDNVKSTNSNIKTVSSSTKDELDSSVLFDITDYIGCNLYIGVGGTSASTIESLKPKMFRDVGDDIDWVTTLLKIGKARNKKIIITEVGCLPYESGLTTPADWVGSGGASEEAQNLYYKIAIGTFLNASNIIGIFIWDACDGFTFIGNTAENTVRDLFGGGN